MNTLKKILLEKLLLEKEGDKYPLIESLDVTFAIHFQTILSLVKPEDTSGDGAMSFNIPSYKINEKTIKSKFNAKILSTVPESLEYTNGLKLKKNNKYYFCYGKSLPKPKQEEIKTGLNPGVVFNANINGVNRLFYGFVVVAIDIRKLFVQTDTTYKETDDQMQNINNFRKTFRQVNKHQLLTSFDSYQGNAINDLTNNINDNNVVTDINFTGGEKPIGYKTLPLSIAKENPFVGFNKKGNYTYGNEFEVLESPDYQPDDKNYGFKAFFVYYGLDEKEIPPKENPPLKLTLEASDLFPENKIELSNTSKLDGQFNNATVELKKYILNNPNNNFLVGIQTYGMASKIPSSLDNVKLAQGRAKSLQNYILNKINSMGNVSKDDILNLDPMPVPKKEFPNDSNVKGNSWVDGLDWDRNVNDKQKYHKYQKCLGHIYVINYNPKIEGSKEEAKQKLINEFNNYKNN